MERPSAVGTYHEPCDDLFDSVGQTIFGVGLHLEDILESTGDPALRAKLDASIRDLHGIIERIRDRGNLHDSVQSR